MPWIRGTVPLLCAVGLAARLVGSPAPAAGPRSFALRSPDGRNVVTIEAGAGLRWSATRDGQPLVAPSSASLTVQGRVLGRGAVIDTRETTVDATITSVFYPRRRLVKDRCHELTVTLDDGLTLVVRAYDDAIAYRFATRIDGTVRGDAEESRLRFPGDPTLYAPLADCAKSAKNGV